MPKVTVYVRNEDLDKWKAVEKKTEFIHNALNPDENDGRLATRYELVDDKGNWNPKEIPIYPDDVKPCKHGYDPKMCKFSKNGKPCK